MRKGDLQTLRRMNRRAILEHLRRQPLTRAELARRTGLAKSAVGRLVEELLQEGLLEEGPLTSPPLGRPGTLLRLKPRARYALGAEMGVEGTVLVALDWLGEVLWHREWPHALGDAPEARLRRLLEAVKPWAEEALGLGITLPGVVQKDRLLLAPNLGWQEVDLDPWAQAFPLPVAFENDAKASALSEVFLHGEGNLAYIVLSRGLGVGVVLEGQLLRGVQGAAGEIGHWLNGGTQPCRCGRIGCLETSLGLPKLLEHYRDLGGQAETLEELVQKAQVQEAQALQTLAHLGHTLGRFIANLAVAYDPGQVVLGGKVASLFPFIAENLQTALESLAFLPHHRTLPVRLSEYGHLAPAVGGASLFLARFFRLGGMWAWGPHRKGGRYEEMAVGTRDGLGA